MENPPSIPFLPSARAHIHSCHIDFWGHGQTSTNLRVMPLVPIAPHPDPLSVWAERLTDDDWESHSGRTNPCVNPADRQIKRQKRFFDRVATYQRSVFT